MLPPEEYVKAQDAITLLLDFLKRRGVAEGFDPDYDGGSYADDLRGLRKTLQRDSARESS